MNEELQKKLVEILSSIQEAAKAGGDFAMSQLPDIAQSYLTYGRITSTSATLLSFVLFLCCLYAFLWGIFSKGKDHYGGMAEGRSVAIMAGCFFGAGTLTATWINASTAMLVWFAPKVWLLKEIARMLK